MLWMRAALLTMAAAGLVLGGCGTRPAKNPEVPKTAPAAAPALVNWCVEHGVPEDICGRCNPKVAADCRQRGDWCQQHARPKSQCFRCDPKLEAQFAAEYEAKQGAKPPKPDGT